MSVCKKKREKHIFLCPRADARRKPRETGWRSDAHSPLRAGRERAMEKRQSAEEDVINAPISILATRQSRVELATSAGISTFWTCNGLFRRGEVKERQCKVDAAGPGVTLLGFPDPYHRGERQRSPGRAPPLGSPHPYPTICRLWVACPVRGWSGRPSPSWSPLLGGRQPLRCRS